MTIEWRILWMCLLGWVIGSFIWWPLVGDLKGSLYDAGVIGFFLGSVRLLQWLKSTGHPRSPSPEQK